MYESSVETYTSDMYVCNCSCVNGYVLRPLNAAADADLIDTLWPNHHQGSRFLIKRLIQWNANMGAYTADSGELVAWCLR